MTPEEQELVLGLVIGVDGKRWVEPDVVLEHFGESDGRRLALRLFREAVAARSALDLECALLATFVFGETAEYLRPLCDLVTEDWHRDHEDVVSLLGDFHSPETIPALVAATRWVPEYLEFDDARALAVKAIHALGDIPGEEAAAALQELTLHEDLVLAAPAGRVLARREN